MRVKSLELLNVKSYSHATIEFSKSINILIGANNSGKSTIIKALMNLQYGGTFDKRDIRSQEISAKTHIRIADLGEKEKAAFYNLRYHDEYEPIDNGDIFWHLGLPSMVEEHLYFNSKHSIKRIKNNRVKVTDRNGKDVAPKQFPRFPDSENQNNFIFPFLAKRKTEHYDSNMNHEQAFKVPEGMRNLAARVQRLENSSHPRHKEFSELCLDILGFNIGVLPIELQHGNGFEPGMYVDGSASIPIKSMGEGVVNIVGFLVTLLTEDNKLYLIEELENDIHPKALKKLLNLIKTKASNNQFVISTHSHIVLKYLGMSNEARIFFIEDVAHLASSKIPTSQITVLENKPEARIDILEKLGYDFQDFELYESYLILEESSAERVIRDFLIPFLVPDLYNRIKTIASKGVDDLPARVIDFDRLFVFIHTNSIYHKKAWVIADGDNAGKNCITQLRDQFKTWPQNHFLNFTKLNFEEFYPGRFKKEVIQVLKLEGQRKRDAKKELLNKIMTWALKNRDQATKEFSKSASEVIELLNMILKSIKK